MTDDPTSESIARDLAEHLESNPGVCADLNVPSGWLRCADGQWQVARYTDSNPTDRVEARVVDRERAIDLLAHHPANLEPAAEAGPYGATDDSVWACAERQDAFDDVERCGWCGTSEHGTLLRRFETSDDGEQTLCPDCYDSWADAGEIEREVPEGETA